MAKHRTAREWASLIARYENGSLTQVAFCRRHHLALSTFGYQLRKHRSSGSRETTVENSADGHLVELAPAFGQSPLITAIGSPEVRIELSTPGNLPVSIHCQSYQVGEIFAQIPNLLPSS